MELQFLREEPTAGDTGFKVNKLKPLINSSGLPKKLLHALMVLPLALEQPNALKMEKLLATPVNWPDWHSA